MTFFLHNLQSLVVPILHFRPFISWMNERREFQSLLAHVQQNKEAALSLSSILPPKLKAETSSLTNAEPPNIVIPTNVTPTASSDAIFIRHRRGQVLTSDMILSSLTNSSTRRSLCLLEIWQCLQFFDLSSVASRTTQKAQSGEFRQ